MSRGTRTIEIYRYDPDVDAAPRMQTYTVELLDSDRMLLDVLLRLKKEDETLTFRRSCREGICGSDGMNINGKNGLACLINMNTLPEKVTVRPLPGLPVVRDVLMKIQTSIARRPVDEPATSKRHFRIMASDYVINVMLKDALQTVHGFVE